MKISCIEVRFGVPVELTTREMQDIHRIVNNAARRSQTVDLVHWAAGTGSKPTWRDPEDPEWDDSVFFIECCARERFATEPFHPHVDLRTKLLEEADFLARKDGGNIDGFEMAQAIARILDANR